MTAGDSMDKARRTGAQASTSIGVGTAHDLAQPSPYAKLLSPALFALAQTNAERAGRCANGTPLHEKCVKTKKCASLSRDFR